MFYCPKTYVHRLEKAGHDAMSSVDLYEGIDVTLIFPSDGGLVVLVVSGLSGSYRPGPLGFLFSGESLVKLQNEVYSRGIDRLWAGAFWNRIAAEVSAKIKFQEKQSEEGGRGE